LDALSAELQSACPMFKKMNARWVEWVIPSGSIKRDTDGRRRRPHWAKLLWHGRVGWKSLMEIDGTRHKSLRARAVLALSEPAVDDVAKLDRLLTDCVAEALALRAEMMRLRRCVEAALRTAEREPSAGRQAQRLLAQRDRFAEAWSELVGSIARLRERRDSATTEA
jgi:hypothetical protein